jgi:RNA polymerase sigma-70 factor (ECF subfamily)
MTIIRNKQAAEDITHDVFLQIMKQSGQIMKSPNPYGFIMVMSRNRVFNVMKREKRNVSVSEIPETAGTADNDDRLILDEAFERLPINQREAVYLHLICGFTFKDTARILNVPQITVKWRYRKALEDMKKHLTIKEDICNEPL